MRFEPSRGHQPDSPMPLLEPDDMTMFASPYHGFEPVKVADDWTEALYGLVLRPGVSALTPRCPLLADKLPARSAVAAHLAAVATPPSHGAGTPPHRTRPARCSAAGGGP
jgi:hypothetical protein